MDGYRTMHEVDLIIGVEKAFDALLSDRLALLCGAGLSMAAPSCLPSAATIARKAKEKYDSIYGADRPPLAESIDDQAQFFFERNELETAYLRIYIDHDAFATEPNSGHFAVADLLLTKGIATAISTNVDTLIETAGNMLFGQVGMGVSRAQVIGLPADKAPFLKIHGSWSDPTSTVWAAGQVQAEPTRTRILQCSEWLQNRLLNTDLVIVGYWTDWDYLNEILETTLGAVNPTRVIVVDPCETATFEAKAPALFALGNRASDEFLHVRRSGDEFLDKLRVKFSRAFLRRVLHQGRTAFATQTGVQPNPEWLEPISEDATVLWHIRRDLEGRNPTDPAKLRDPIDEPLLGMTLLQLQARGAVSAGQYWNLNSQKVRVLRAANRPLHEVQAAFARDMAPIVAPDVVIAVGAEPLTLPASIARELGGGSIARGPSSRWLSRQEAITEFEL